MNRIGGQCYPQIRDGLLGPEEIKVSGAVLYEIDRLGVSRLNMKSQMNGWLTLNDDYLEEIVLGLLCHC